MQTLTIAIPTYNRPGKARDRVLQIQQQTDKVSQILILDNHSDNDVEKEILDSAVVMDNVRIVKNVVNIGGGANFCRCFELNQSDWIWVMGDDDELCDTALEDVLKVISELEDSKVGYINFGIHMYPNESNSEITKLIDFESPKWTDCFFSNLLFITSGVYRSKAIQGHLRTGYFAVYACAPQLAMICEMIHSGEYHAAVRTEMIVKHAICDEGQHWSNVKLLSGIISLFEMENAGKYMKPIVQSIVRNVRWRPFFKGGLKYIFCDHHRTVQFWFLILSRVFIVGCFQMRFRAILLILLLPLAINSTLRKSIGNLLSNKDIDSSIGMERM